METRDLTRITEIWEQLDERGKEELIAFAEIVLEQALREKGGA